MQFRDALYGAGLAALLVLALSASSPAGDGWTDVIRPFGDIEVRAFHLAAAYEAANLDDHQTSDIFIRRAGLGLDANLGGRVTGRAGLFYEEGRTEPVDLEEAWLKVKWRGAFSSFGRMYLPYGGLRTFGVEDPIAYEMTRSRRTAALVGYESRYFDVKVGAFNGSVDERDQEDDLIDTLSAGLVVRPFAMFDGVALELGGFYLSDCLEVDDFFEGVADPRQDPYDDEVAGYGGYLWGRVDPLNILGFGFGAEYVTTQEFDERDFLDAKGQKAAVWALDSELAIFLFGSVRLMGRYETIEGWDYLQAAGPPDIRPTGYRRYGGGMGLSPIKGLDAALEYLYGEDFEGDKTGLFQFGIKCRF